MPCIQGNEIEGLVHRPHFELQRFDMNTNNNGIPWYFVPEIQYTVPLNFSCGPKEQMEGK